MRRNTRTCFQCGKPGHFVADCPEKVENKDGYKHKSRMDVSVFKPLDLHGRYPQQSRRWGSP
jgi:hypothetical protein